MLRKAMESIRCGRKFIAVRDSRNRRIWKKKDSCGGDDANFQGSVFLRLHEVGHFPLLFSP
jgi:hypothetical protein